MNIENWGLHFMGQREAEVIFIFDRFWDLHVANLSGLLDEGGCVKSKYSDHFTLEFDSDSANTAEVFTWIHDKFCIAELSLSAANRLATGKFSGRSVLLDHFLAEESPRLAPKFKIDILFEVLDRHFYLGLVPDWIEAISWFGSPFFKFLRVRNLDVRNCISSIFPTKFRHYRGHDYGLALNLRVDFWSTTYTAEPLISIFYIFIATDLSIGLRCRAFVYRCTRFFLDHFFFHNFLCFNNR